MTVTDMARVLQRMWPVIVIITALGVLAGALALVVSTPRYDATSRMFVSTQSLGSAQELLQGSTYTQARIGSYAAVASDPIVLQPVIDELGLDTTVDALASQISTSVERESLIISITVTDDSPTAAADIVNAVTDELATVIEDQLESPVAGSQSLVSVSVTREATVPTAPVSPVPWIMISVGLGAGLLLGFGVAFVLAAGDTRVRSVDEIQAITDLPIIGAVALDRGLSPQAIVDRPHQTSRAHEAFRTIRTNLRFMEVDSTRQVLLVTSSIPGEGKSVTAITLARTLAEAGDSVILVDADMRLPRMADYLGIEGSVGLSDALIGRIDREDVVQRLGDVATIPAGRVPPNPSELLGSQRFVDFIDELRREYDHVIIDAPPIVPVTDAAVISRAVDGVVVVAAAAHVLNKQLQAALTALERVGAPVLGIIANRLPRRGMDAYAQYGYGYVAEAEAAAEAKADAESVERRGGRGSKTGPQRASASVD